MGISRRTWEKTLQCEIIKDENLGAWIKSQKDGMHAASDTTYIDTRLTTL